MAWLAFALGVLLGALFMVFALCLCQMAREERQSGVCVLPPSNGKRRKPEFHKPPAAWTMEDAVQEKVNG